MKSFQFWACSTLLLPGLLWAHGDEDHSHGDAKPATVAVAAPALRVQAASELFELVAALEGDKLVMHLDRYATNEPVTGATIAVEGGPLPATTAVEANGVYTVAAAGLAAPGTHALVFTVQAGTQSDLLTGDMVVTPTTPATTGDSGGLGRLGGLGGLGAQWIAIAVTVLLILGAGTWALRRRRVALAGDAS